MIRVNLRLTDRCSRFSTGLRAGTTVAQCLQRLPQVQSALHGHAQGQGMVAYGPGERMILSVLLPPYSLHFYKPFTLADGLSGRPERELL